MATPSVLFFDIGGVLLTNAWDTPARARAVSAFELDEDDFQARHGMLKTAFETGRLSLDGYIRKAVFSQPRSFSPDDFKKFMYEQSMPLGETLNWVRSLAKLNRYRLFTLNNESRELHEYRARTFGLFEIFDAFFTSCYLGQAKPDEDIYINALGIAGCDASDAIFIDDRSVNVETARTLGLNAIRFKSLDDLQNELKDLGLVF
jgi:putative hydrolase of the HAD superfamily